MKAVQKYANQKQITVNKAVCDKSNIYTAINKRAMLTAMKTFAGRKAPAFSLWCYIASNQNGYSFALSQKDIEETIGLKKDGYETAVNNLIAEGYLVLQSGKTIYNFYEIPQQKEG